LARDFEQESEFVEQVVHINRVTKVVKGGKNLSFSALVVIGDGNGRVGYGDGKAKEVPMAIRGHRGGQEEPITVPTAGNTIPHESTGVRRRAGAARPASPAPASSPAARCAR
jgi:small subunit ribosomal protein S5